MLIRRRALPIILATILLVITTFIPNSANVTYSDIMGCETECVVVATGYPFAFIADYPGLSPANSADLMGLLMGWDKIIWANLDVSVFFWLFVSLLIINLLRKYNKKLT